MSMPEQAKALCGGEKTHIYSFDYLRLFAMCSVVFMHMASAQLRGERGLGWHAANILTSLAFTAVPLFFMMSGALLLSGSRTANLRLLWRKRIPRLLLPLLFWSLVHVVLFRFWGGKTTQESLDSLLAVPYKPVYGHLWYMYTLIALYAISPFLFHMTRAMDQPARRYLAWLIFGILALDAVRMLAPASAARYLQLDLASALRFLNTNLFSFLLGWLLDSMYRRPTIHFTYQKGTDDFSSYQKDEHEWQPYVDVTLQEAYRTLGIRETATDDEVRQAYRELALRYHPDRVEAQGEAAKEEAEKKFREVTEARDIIFRARGV